MDRRSFANGIPSRGSDGPKTVVDVNVYLAERRLDVCDEQVEHGGMFWPQTLKVSQSVSAPFSCTFCAPSFSHFSNEKTISAWSLEKKGTRKKEDLIERWYEITPNRSRHLHRLSVHFSKGAVHM